MTNEYRDYQRVILTKTGRITTVYPKNYENKHEYSEMGEVGERLVAEKIQRILDGHDVNVAGLDPSLICKDYVCLTTQMMVEQKVLRADDERPLQYTYGVDLVVFHKDVFSRDKPPTVREIVSYPERCYQVKLQPLSTGYRSITVETCNDDKYYKKKELPPAGSPCFSPSGINKTISKHTVYIVSGAAMLFMNTEQLRELVRDENSYKLKYIGGVRFQKGGGQSRSVGTTVPLHTLFETCMAKATNIGDVFRTYLCRSHKTGEDKPDEGQYGWKLFVQDWPVETLEKFVRQHYLLTDLPVRGDRYNHYW